MPVRYGCLTFSHCKVDFVLSCCIDEYCSKFHGLFFEQSIRVLATVFVILPSFIVFIRTERVFKKSGSYVVHKSHAIIVDLCHRGSELSLLTFLIKCPACQ